MRLSLSLFQVVSRAPTARRGTAALEFLRFCSVYACTL